MQNLDAFSIVLILGIVQGLFLALMLISKKRNKTANKTLGLLMLCYSFFIAQSLLFGLEAYRTIPHYLYFIGDFPFVFGPLHYLYARVLIYPNIKFSKKQLLHFLPYLFNKAFYFPLLFESKEYLSEIYQGLTAFSHDSWTTIFLAAVIIQGLTYMVLTLLLLKRHSISIKDNFSSLDSINLNWLRTITVLTLFVWIIVLIDKSTIALGMRLFPVGDSVIAAATSLLIYAMGYLGFGQVEIFSQRSFTESPEKSPANPKTLDYIFETNDLTPYKKFSLPPEKATKYLQSLLDLMEEEKLFKDCDLTLQALADKLSISTNNLSEVINSQLKQNFFDFINKYRVEEVKSSMKDPENSHFTILSLAFDAGFNSKSSFNSVFKKHTNMTPSQYKNNAENG